MENDTKILIANLTHYLYSHPRPTQAEKIILVDLFDNLPAHTSYKTKDNIMRAIASIMIERSQWPQNQF